MPIDFNVKPRHVQMFGAQGILAPLYQRQATKLALQEEERRSQSRFEQMKALTELRARLQRQAGAPMEQARIGQMGAAQELSEFRLGQAQADEELISQFGAATTQEERNSIAQQILARGGNLQGLMPTQERQFAPPRHTFMIDPETGMPLIDEVTGKQISVPGTAKFLPGDTGALKTSRISLASRKLKELSAKYNPESKREIRMDYSGLDWNSRAIKSIGIERAGAFGFAKGVVGGGRDDLMNNIMQVMATPATITDPNTGAVSEDTAEFNRRANIIARFRAEIMDDPEGKSKEKLKEVLHNMEEMMTNARILSREEAQVMQSQTWGSPSPDNENLAPPDMTGGIYNTWTP